MILSIAFALLYQRFPAFRWLAHALAILEVALWVTLLVLVLLAAGLR